MLFLSEVNFLRGELQLLLQPCWQPAWNSRYAASSLLSLSLRSYCLLILTTCLLLLPVEMQLGYQELHFTMSLLAAFPTVEPFCVALERMGMAKR